MSRLDPRILVLSVVLPPRYRTVLPSELREVGGSHVGACGRMTTP